MPSDVERLAGLEARMTPVEAGVSNFRIFQAEARDFFSEHRASEKAHREFQDKRDQEIKERLDRRDRRFSIAIAVLMVLLSYLAYRDSTQKTSFAIQAPSFSTQDQPQMSTIPKSR
jgi:hypothetical protein